MITLICIVLRLDLHIYIYLYRYTYLYIKNYKKTYNDVYIRNY